MAKKVPRETQQVGWRIPASLYADLGAYAQQTHRSAVSAAIVLLTKGLTAAAKRGEYVPPKQDDDAR